MIRVNSLGLEPYGDPKNTAIFDVPLGKYNTNIILDETDKKNKVKITCKDDYALDMFKVYKEFFGENNILMPKDLIIGQVYGVTVKSYMPEHQIYVTEEANSKTQIHLAASDCGHTLQEIQDNPHIHVVITREHGGMFFGSNKKYNDIHYKQELDEAYKNNTPFEVRIIELIKGGYRALYKDSVECFIPGGQAAANIIHDFQSYIGKVINVMIDNYDPASMYYIVSYKKYVKFAMLSKVKELRFDNPYIGHLTDNPTKFGLFVEFGNGFFTGLIHSSEFHNYEDTSKHYRKGDEVEFYIKDVATRRDPETNEVSYRIVLTLDKENVNRDMTEWQGLKNEVEGRKVNFRLNDNKDFFIIRPDNLTEVRIRIPFRLIKNKVYHYNSIFVKEVDVINKILDFEFR